MKTLNLELTPFLLKILARLAFKRECTIPECIRMCIFIVGAMEDCLPDAVSGNMEV